MSLNVHICCHAAWLRLSRSKFRSWGRLLIHILQRSWGLIVWIIWWSNRILVISLLKLWLLLKVGLTITITTYILMLRWLLLKPWWIIIIIFIVLPWLFIAAMIRFIIYIITTTLIKPRLHLWFTSITLKPMLLTHIT